MAPGRLFSRVASREYIHLASSSRSRPATTDGCVRFANSDSEDKRVLENEFTAPNGNTPESCLNLCHERGYILGGVENGGASCRTCFKCLLDGLQVFPLLIKLGSQRL